MTDTALVEKTATKPTVYDPIIDRIREELAQIEEDVVTGYTLADAIREGSQYAPQAYDWGNAENTCALSAAFTAARARGMI